MPTPTRRPGPLGPVLSPTVALNDRAAGVLMGMACGDALGAPHEFGPPLPASQQLTMSGGGSFGWAPGEWTDDTQMAVVILEAAERAVADRDRAHRDGAPRPGLLDRLDDVVQGWTAWAATARDVGIQTRAVLSAAAAGGRPTARSLSDAAAAHHERTGRSGGNGSLMRTAPVALAYLDDEAAMAGAARTLSDLTHPDPDAGDACVLWCAAIRHAVLTAELDLRRGLVLLPPDRRPLWSARIEEAEARTPADFPRNGWVVQALQGAWSAITTTPVPVAGPELQPGDHLRRALEAAVRGGRDTDTVAAIAGGLLGARWGASAIPAPWRRVVHGWPGLGVTELGLRGLALARGWTGHDTWPLADTKDYFHLGVDGYTVAHPFDAGVLLGDAGALEELPDGVDAVVSLCRVGRRRPAGVGVGDHVEVWLLDTVDRSHNPNLELVFREAADVVAALRAEGRTVLLHCAAGQSRTPAVAAAYAVRHLGADPATVMAQVGAVLRHPRPNQTFCEVVAASSAASALSSAKVGA